MRERNNRSRLPTQNAEERPPSGFALSRLPQSDSCARCPRRPRALCFEIEKLHPETNHDGTLYVLFTGVRAIFPVR